MLEQRFSLRCHGFAKGQEQVLAVFFGRNGYIVSQQLQREVVSELYAFGDANGAVGHCLEFFDLPDEVNHPAIVLAELPLGVLDTWQTFQPDSDMNTLIGQLENFGLEKNFANDLAASIAATEARGSISRIEGLQETPISNQGLLLLKGDNQAWIFKI